MYPMQMQLQPYKVQCLVYVCKSISGQPGAEPRIIVRGGTSINNPNGATPLYIIDGVMRANMVHIASEDIESIQILKDAAATSIYGPKVQMVL